VIVTLLSRKDKLQSYRRLNNELRRIDKAKGNWRKEQCEEFKKLEMKGRTELLYWKVKSLQYKKK